VSKSARLATAILSIAVALGLATAIWGLVDSRRPNQPSGPPERLTIAVVKSYVGSGLVMVAAANGYFRDAGLDVTLQPHPSGKATLEAVFAGKADLATASDTPLMFAIVSGRPLLIVATIASGITDHGIVARKDRGIAIPGDLRDKRLGVTFGTSAHFFLDVARSFYRLPSAPVGALIDLQPEALEAALLAGEVDAISTWSPILDRAARDLGDNAIRFPGKDLFQYTFNLAGSATYVRANEETMKKLVRALDRADRFVATHRAEARAIVEQATGAGYGPNDKRWDDYDLRLTLAQRLLIMLEDEARWAIKQRFVQKAELPNFLGFIYLDAMAAVKPEALTIIH